MDRLVKDKVEVWGKKAGALESKSSANVSHIHIQSLERKKIIYIILIGVSCFNKRRNCIV